MGVIMEYEGVLVEDTSELHSQAWEQLGREEQKARPLHHALKRSEGMKAEQASTPTAAQAVLHWGVRMSDSLGGCHRCLQAQMLCWCYGVQSVILAWAEGAKSKPLRKELHACCLLPA